ncbi:uncharacterized protein [Argopecten irradians]|uniref:uncharacterized protein n=1 Tax=Argopecten irradians TaxID=31199 RepID=UPI003723AB6E
MSSNAKRKRTEPEDDTAHVEGRKKDTDDNVSFDIFREFPRSVSNLINLALDSLIDIDENFLPPVTLTPVKILMCNAADKHEGFSFSKAYCSSEMYGTDYAFGAIFRKGVNLLIDMLDNRTPENRQHKYVLSRLLHYLHDMKNLHLKSLESNNLTSLTEAELTTVLANHLLVNLSASSYFVIDKQHKENEKYGGENIHCPCESERCQPSGYFGDTSLGNGLVWHGNLDIIINNEVIVDVEANEDNSQNDNPKRHSLVKNQSCSLSGHHQIISETIVFSFLQKQRHPESDNFLLPCIAVSAQDLVIYFYDSLHDVLLESCNIPLHGVFPSPATGSVNLIAVVVIWLVVNYRYLCDGIVDEMKSTKAGFFSHAESKLGIYHRNLRFGDVRHAFQQSNDASVNLGRERHQHPDLNEMKIRKNSILPI